MSVNVGSATGYLDLDISGFLSSLQSAQSAANRTASNMATKVGDKISSIGDKLTSAGSTLTKFVSVPLAGVGVAGLKVATDFEKGMSEVRAISGAVGKEFDALRDKAIELGASTAFSAGEVASAMTEMAKAGWSSQQILDGMGGVLDAAAASGEALGTVSTIVADTITGFGMAAADSTRVADLLTQAANSGTIGINDLGESFKYIAPVAGSMGISVEDVTTAIAAMSMAGIKGSAAGTSLRTMLTNLVKPTDTVAGAMRDLGLGTIDAEGAFVSLVSNADGSIKSLDELIGIMRTSMAGMTDEQKAATAAALAGKEGMSGLLSILNLTEEEYNKIAESMDNANGVAQETATVMQDNLQSKFEQFTGALESLAIVLADYVIPHIQDFILWLTGVVEKFAAMDEGTQKLILTIAGIVVAAGPVLLVVGKLTSGIGSIVTAIGKLVASRGAAASISSVGSAAANASSGTGAAAASFGNLAGQALKLVAAGASLIMVATAVKMLADSAIAIADAGWPAAAAFALLTAGAIGATAAIVAIGSASTATAPGLLAMGAAVLMVTSGIAAVTAAISLVINAVANLVDSFTRMSSALPTIAQYGTKAASSLTALAGSIALVSAAMLGLAGAVTTGLLPFVGAAATIGLVDVALAAMLVTSGLAAAGIVALGVSLKGVASQMEAIRKDTKTTAKTLESMVVSIDIVDASLSGLKAAVKSAASDFISAFSKTKPSANDFSTNVTNMQSKVTTAMNGIKTATKSGAADVQTNMSLMSNAVSKEMTTSTTKIVSFATTFVSQVAIVKKSIKDLENAFANAKFEFDTKIKLPHFYMSGSFNAQTGSVPAVGVRWYKNAMSGGMILNGATIFGFDPRTGKFLGGGESGSETVVGTESLMKMIRQAVTDAIAPFTTMAYQFAKSSNELGYIIRSVVTQREKTFDKASKAVQTSSTGDTFNFYSPKAINEVEAAKQMKKAKRDLAEGF